MLRRVVWKGVLVVVLGVVAGPVRAVPARLLVFIDTAAASPWYAQFIESLRQAVRERHPEAELDIETLPDQPDGADDGPPHWLLEKYALRHYDILLAARPDVLQSTVLLRDRLWPRATVVAPMGHDELDERLASAQGLTGLSPNRSTVAAMDLIFRLLPDTRQVAVITRDLDHDALRPDWQEGLAALQRHATLIDLSGLSLEPLLERVQRLPPKTALFFAAPGVSGSRVAAPRDQVALLARQANAPVFVDASTLLGTGVIGGAVLSPEGLAHDIAQQVHALLAGTPAQRIGLQPQSPLRAVFDWHALQRWHVPMERLPVASEVLEQPPALWEAYRNQVLSGAALVVLQSALIAALLVERRRRRRAELQAREQLAHLARLNRSASLGALSAALAHEINQPLGAILSNAETAELLLERPGDTHRQALRELLGAIREDNQRAAQVLQRLRAWMADRPPTLQPTALAALLQEVATWLSAELQLRDTELALVLTPALPWVQADEVQVQQVILNLVLNALDALQSVPPRQRRIVIGTATAGPHTVEISVCDNGPGLGEQPPERLFEPFFTTKPTGLGVGLAISRSIVELHGGRLWAENTAAGGACFRFTLVHADEPAPLPQAA